MSKRNHSSGVLTFILATGLFAAAMTMYHDWNADAPSFSTSSDHSVWNHDPGVSTDKKVDSLIDKIISEHTSESMSDAQKVKAIHDYIILNCAYDYDNYLNNTLPDESYSPKGVLLNQTAVCEGYAKTFKAFMDKLEIPCEVVIGIGYGGDTEDHAWNLVQIDNKWFHIDLTWDDPVPDTPGYVGYSYFLIPDQVMEQDHQWKNTDYPACTTSCDQFITLLGSVCQSNRDIEYCLYEAYVKKSSYTIIVPASFIDDYESLAPCIWDLEENQGIQLPHQIRVEEYGSYNIYTLVEETI